jgi:AcrR family transcriptional regulator
MTKAQAMGIRAQRKAERPGEILEATFQVFLHKGYDGTRIEDVAARLGVTKGTIYFYFATKEDLFSAMVQDFSQALFADITNFTGGLEGLASSRLRAFIGFLYRSVSMSPKGLALLRFLIAEGNRFPALIDAHRGHFVEPTFEQCRLLIAAGVASGEFRPAAVSQLPDIVLGPIMALAMSILTVGGRLPIDIDQYIDLHCDLLMNGLMNGEDRS